MKKWFESFLKKLGDANKESFGTGRMDCCEVNQKSNNSQKKK